MMSTLLSTPENQLLQDWGTSQSSEPKRGLRTHKHERKPTSSEVKGNFRIAPGAANVRKLE